MAAPAFDRFTNSRLQAAKKGLAERLRRKDWLQIAPPAVIIDSAESSAVNGRRLL